MAAESGDTEDFHSISFCKSQEALSRKTANQEEMTVSSKNGHEAHAQELPTRVKEHLRNLLRKRSAFTRFRGVDNSLEEYQSLHVSFSRDLTFIRFHLYDGSICCVPFTHIRKACFGPGSQTLDLGEADGTRIFTLYFHTLRTMHLQASSRSEAVAFLKALFWLKFGQDPVNLGALRQSIANQAKERIYVYSQSEPAAPVHWTLSKLLAQLWTRSCPRGSGRTNQILPI
eukprot:g56266.t1